MYIEGFLLQWFYWITEGIYEMKYIFKEITGPSQDKWTIFKIRDKMLWGRVLTTYFVCFIESIDFISALKIKPHFNNAKHSSLIYNNPKYNSRGLCDTYMELRGYGSRSSFQRRTYRKMKSKDLQGQILLYCSNEEREYSYYSISNKKNILEGLHDVRLLHIKWNLTFKKKVQ